MPMRYPTPEALVEALHRREPAARVQLREWVGEPIHRLVQQLHARHRLPHKLERLTSHALHAAETYLRTHSPAEFHGMNIESFRGTVLVQAARQMVQPFGGGQDGRSMTPEPLPESEAFESRAVFLPSEKIGTFWFGGDWYGGRLEPDGTLWLIVADITGHGYAAYLLANALPAVWRRCWAEGRIASREPADVLAAMHDLLHDCLPDGVFVECTLLRLDPDGKATLAPAGGARLLLHKKQSPRPELLKLRGLWLGFDRPSPEHQHVCTLREGDELLLGTDGIFDQLLDHAGPGGDMTVLVGEAMTRGDLLDAVQEVLRRALSRQPQKDDITAVTIRRRPPRGRA